MSLSESYSQNILSQTCSCSGGGLLLRRGGSGDAGKAWAALPEPDHGDVGLDGGVGPGEYQGHGWMIVCLNSANNSRHHLEKEAWTIW